MAEASTGEVVVLHLADELVPKWNPFGGALGGPPAGTSGSIAAEANFLSLLLIADQRFQSLQQTRATFCVEAGCEPHVVELALIVVESEQQ